MMKQWFITQPPKRGLFAMLTGACHWRFTFDRVRGVAAEHMKMKKLSITRLPLNLQHVLSVLRKLTPLTDRTYRRATQGCNAFALASSFGFESNSISSTQSLPDLPAKWYSVTDHQLADITSLDRHHVTMWTFAYALRAPLCLRRRVSGQSTPLTCTRSAQTIVRSAHRSTPAGPALPPSISSLKQISHTNHGHRYICFPERISERSHPVANDSSKSLQYRASLPALFPPTSLAQ